MKIEKFIQSCLRLTLRNEQLLFDPGKFSFNGTQLTPEALVSAGMVVITHDHPDHLDLDAIKVIAEETSATRATRPAKPAKRKAGLARNCPRAGPRPAGRRKPPSPEPPVAERFWIHKLQKAASGRLSVFSEG